MKVKVSEAKEQVLDYLVALIKFPSPDYEDDDRLVYIHGDDEFHFAPSIYWSQGGPIIEREWLDVTPWPNESREDMRWHCQQHDTANDFAQYGPTLLIAAMRCYVASKLGDEVEVPEELKGVTA